MDRNFAPALALVLRSEGGWADHPRDPGGPTNKGVTLATFRQYVKPDATVADLHVITDDQVAVVYKRQYWSKVLGSDLPGGLDYAVFDFAIHSGPARAVRYLQAIVGAKQDGVMGPATLAAVKKRDIAELITALNRARLAFLRKLDTFSTFGRGWVSRLKTVEAEAQKLAAQPDDAPVIVERFIPELVATVVPGLDKPLTKSSIAWGSVAQTAIGGMSTFAAFDWKVAVPIVVVIGMLASWIIYQRGQLAAKQRDTLATATVTAG